MSKLGIAPEILTLPKGGGAIEPIGETFEPDIFTGSGNYRIPLWFPKGVRGFSPDINLVYSTTLGNSAFGFGWRLDLMSIRRQVDRGLPRYNDDEGTFLLGNEKLVPIGNEEYRLQTRPYLLKIKKVGDGWEVQDRDGNRFRLGNNANSRQILQVDERSVTLAWFVSEAIDPFGNAIHYSYDHDQGQMYLSSLQYACYHVDFHYEKRSDPMTDCRSGSPIITGQRCAKIEYHLLDESESLFRRYTFQYEYADGGGHSLLTQVKFSGFRPGTGGTETAEQPSLTFEYTPFSPRRPRLRGIGSTWGAPPPTSLADPEFTMVDIFARGLPDVVQLGFGAGRYWPNAGRGNFGYPRQLSQFPAALTLSESSVAFADMDGTATADLFDLQRQPNGFYPNRPGEGWQTLQPLKGPGLPLNNPNLRLLDLDGDHVTDALLTGGSYFFLFFNRLNQGWEAAQRIRRIRNLEQWPNVFFSDPRVKLADMNGDGLIDIVQVHSGRIDYWPYMGYGRWGSRVSLDLTPNISRNFDPNRLFLTDLDGDGLADVVYIDARQIFFWMNRSGDSLSSRGVICHTPSLAGAHVMPVDMTGSGTPGVLWTYDHSRLNRRNYKYLDFTRDQKPYLLTRIHNGMGLVTEIEYRSSTEFLLDDQKARQPWQTSLPFPVTTVSIIIQRDTINGIEQKRTYRYHDGLFDGKTREFRGYGRVEAFEEGDESIPTARTVSFFHQGTASSVASIQQQEIERARAGKLYRLEMYAVDGSALENTPFRIEESDWAVQPVMTGLNATPILFPHLLETVVRNTERSPNERRSRTLLDYDSDGNVSRKDEIYINEDGTEEHLISHFDYAVHPTGLVRGKASQVRIEDLNGTVFSLRRFYYDGPPHQGLPFGQLDTGLVSRQEDLVLSQPVINAAYGASPPNFQDLGYHSTNLPDGSNGWASNTIGRAYDAQGRLLATSDADGNITSIMYDSRGLNPQEIHMPLNKVFNVQYAYRAQAVAVLTDPNGHSSSYHFDPLGRVSALVKPGDAAALPTLSVQYRSDTFPTSVVMKTRIHSGSPEIATSARYFDGFGRTCQQRTEAENGQVLVETETVRNRRGLVVESIRPFFSTGLDYIDEHGPSTIRYRYDGLGRQVNTVMGDGVSTRTDYGLYEITRYDATDTDDSAENRARGHFDTPKTEKISGSGRIIAVTERKAGGEELTSKYEYDAVGRLEKITDARGLLLASYIYDHLGRKIRITHLDAGEHSFSYTARGNLAGSTTPANQVIRYEHDSLNRLSTVGVDGIIVERRFYDSGTGANLQLRLSKVEDDAGTLEFSYNERGLVAEKKRTVSTNAGTRTFTSGYVYDARENLEELTYPDGHKINYSYSPRGLLLAIPTYVDEIEYNGLGQVTNIRYANGVESENQYETANSLLRQARIYKASTGEEYSNYSFSYDAIGNPLRITDNIMQTGHQRFERQFRYDALHRLIGSNGAIGAVPFKHDYSYDKAGNFSSNSEFIAGELTLANTGDSNRLEGVTVNNVTTPLFSYDAAGNLASMPGMNLIFDARNHLTQVQKTDGTQIQYRYGFDGERVVKRVTRNGLTKESIYIDGIYEWHNGNTVRHIIDSHRRYAIEEGGVTRFVHTDNLGSTIIITASDGSLLYQAGYFAYGSKAYRQAGDEYSHRFLQQYLDEETGLYYFKARYFHPGLGRFISPDPAILTSPDSALQVPQGLNPYVYALNNPVRLIDVNGNWWKWIVGGLIIAALAVLTVVTYGGASAIWAAAAPYFGYFAAALTGAVIGGAVGITHAAVNGQDLADGFLFGVLIGAAAGAAGYWAGTVTAGAIGGPWGNILGQAVQGAIVGFGDGLIQGIAGGKGVLETLESAFVGAAIGLAIGFVVEGLGQWMQTWGPNWTTWIGKNLLCAKSGRWWFYWTSLLRPLPKAWAFEQISNWLSDEETSSSSAALSSYNSTVAGLSSPQSYTVATPIHFNTFVVSVDEFLEGALNILITGARKDVETAVS